MVLSRQPVRPDRAGYLPALDGLRAMAVIGVVLYHLGFTWIPGGYLGVDLFFVISGFLITMLLVDEARRTNRVRIGSFWLRRARRLFPALVVMVVVVTAAVFVLGRDLDVGLRRQVFGAAIYGSNWVQIAGGTSYVDRYTPEIFTHLWSLAVEEQFYLIWPFVVVLLLSFLPTRRSRVWTVLGLAAVSAGLMALLFVPGADPTRVYVGTDTHGFALLLGAALGLGMRFAAARRPAAVRPPEQRPWLSALGVLGYMGVLAGMLLLSDTAPAAYRGGILAVDVFAVALVAAAARGAGPVGLVFSLPLLRWVGKRSYGIYLWHWPLIVIAARMLPFDAPMWQQVVLVVVGTMVLTELSYRFVERPIRTHGFVGAMRRAGWTIAGRVAAAPARRGLGLAAVTGFALVLTIAAIGVVAAPTRSALADQLAAGEAAVAEYSATAADGAGFGQPDPTTTGSPVEAGTPAPLTTPAMTAPTSGAPSRAGAPGPTTRASTSAGPKVTGSPKTRAVPKTTVAPTTAAPKTTAPPKTSTAPKTTAAPKPTPKPTPTPVQPRGAAGPVTAIGDSVMLGAAPELLAEFPHLDIDAKVGRQWWDLPGVVSAHVKGGVGAVVVVSLGTNGTWSAGDIQGALAPLGNRPVVLVNTFENRSWSADVNAQIAAVAAARAHTCVADWHSLAAKHPQWVSYDGVHPDAEGRGAYADLLRQAVDSCR